MEARSVNSTNRGGRATGQPRLIVVTVRTTNNNAVRVLVVVFVVATLHRINIMSDINDQHPEKTETAYQLGVPVANDQASGGSSNYQNYKRGHLCCGGCCDMRRAVVVVNIVQAALLLLGIMGAISFAKSSAEGSDEIDDDEFKAAYEEFSRLPVGGFIAIQSLKIICCILGIFGALHYNLYMTGIAAAAFCFDFVRAMVGFNIFGLIFSGFFAYPHFFFIKEVREGIMSKENYNNERMSCCCV
jgi:hypothetical protein